MGGMSRKELSSTCSARACGSERSTGWDFLKNLTCIVTDEVFDGCLYAGEDLILGQNC